MTTAAFFVACLFALILNLLWRWRFPLASLSGVGLVGIAAAGVAVGVFAGFVVGGSALSDNWLWQFVATPVVAAIISARGQTLADSWTQSGYEKPKEG